MEKAFHDQIIITRLTRRMFTQPKNTTISSHTDNREEGRKRRSPTTRRYFLTALRNTYASLHECFALEKPRSTRYVYHYLAAAGVEHVPNLTAMVDETG